MIQIKIVQFLQRNWKWIAIIALIVIALLSIKSCNEYKASVADISKAKHFDDSLSNSKLKQWKDENGNLHTTVDNLYVEHFAMQYQLDSITKILAVKPTQVISYVKIDEGVKLDVKPKVDTLYKSIPCNGNDSVYVASSYSLSWRDKWMNVRGELNGVNDSINVDGRDTLSLISYGKRKWFLGAKHYYTDITNSNPHISVKGYKGAEFKGTDQRWNIGLSVMYGYPVQNINFQKPSLFVGISAGYSLLKF